jgi:Carboxypeptidase regulatory-like domain
MRAHAGWVGLAAVALVAFCAAGVSPASAQIVRGQVVDATTLTPIPGAFIVLVDSAGTERGGVLSGEGGGFVLKAPGPGRYTLRAERIGYTNALSDTLRLDEDATLEYRFAVAALPIDLEGMKVTGKNRCRLSRDMGAQTEVLWEEVRKALSISVLGDRERGVAYQAETWSRSRSIHSGEILSDTVAVVSGYGRRAFTSESARELGTKGFVRVEPDGSYMFYGLDAQTLLSDEFLGAHCFRVQKPRKSEKGLIGLAFQPLGRKGPPDITGTLWVDRATSELRYMEFTYDRIPGVWGLSTKGFGGRVDFRRLDNGDWVVVRWWLRMPQSVTVMMNASGRIRHGALRIHEQGGAIRFIGTARGSGAEGESTLSGTVYDSVRSGPLGGANVFLTDIDRATTTDPLGHFEFRGLPAGRHEVAFTHAYADALGLPVWPRAVSVDPNHDASITLAIPSDAGCHGDAAVGGIVGFVEDPDSGDPVAGAVVHAEWSTPGDKGPFPTPGKVGRHVTIADGYGRYLFCNVPRGRDVDLAAEKGPTATLRLGASGLAWQQLLVRPR